MKILYIITKSNWGGAQRHVYDLATAMKNGGNDVAVAVGGNGTLRTRLEAAGIYTHSISVLGRDVSIGSDFQSFREIISIIRHRRPDVIHLHSPKAAGLGALAGRLFRVKHIIMTVHGWSFNESRPIYERVFIAFFSWLTALLCHKVILISERDYAQALHFPFIKDKLRLVMPGIKPPVFLSIDGARQILAKHIGMDIAEFSKKTIIGTIAELHSNKGLSYFVNAFSAVARAYPNALSLVIGDGEDKSSLAMLIKERGLEKNMFLLGYMDDAAEYLKAFNIFALPSIKEGLPYVMLEAGFAGLPVVATTVGGIPEVVDDMRSGVLVQPKNIRELSHALSFMIEHTDERKKYGSALREKVSTNFSVEKMVKGVEEVYLLTVVRRIRS